jgi:hypothetical protein
MRRHAQLAAWRSGQHDVVAIFRAEVIRAGTGTNAVFLVLLLRRKSDYAH